MNMKISPMPAPAVTDMSMTCIAKSPMVEFPAKSPMVEFPVNDEDAETKDDRDGSDTDTEWKSGAGTFCEEPQKPGTSWMRMRTPSPVTPRYQGSAGRDPPLPAGPPGNMLKLPSAILNQPYIAFKAVVSSPKWWTQGEDNSTQDGKHASRKTSTDTQSTTASTESKRGSMQSVQSFEENMSVPKVTAENAPSKGSIGHPYCCAAACKYNKKARGCKDGPNCDRCHLCVFRCIKPRKVTGEEVMLCSPVNADAPPPPPRTQTRPKRRTQPKDSQNGEM